MTGVSILKYLHVSEKSSHGQQMNQYTFIVTSNATKPEIAKAVQAQYRVSVTSVNVTRLPGKRRAVGRFTGSTSGIKKAIVTLAEGQSIATA